ncbi:MAG: AAA family ATPase [Nitriliruptoraceae bacterium]|nr:AAA family ATPase [Nitriliruptoraceae bacterium]
MSAAPLDLDQLATSALRHADPEPAPSFDRHQPGGAFVLDQPDGVPAVWGDGNDVIWSKGEPLLVCGPPGVGKTTLGQQAVLRRAGVLDGQLLGLPVEADDRPTLYIAADRPRQAARSLRRMVSEEDRRQLDRNLIVWRGPLPFDLTTDPERLASMADHYGVGTVVIDSLKDVAPGLEKPEVGSALNVALQHLVAADIETMGLHHQRKASGDNRKPTGLADVYGSAWITAGAGSVVLLWGAAGDPIVELTHLKQPAELVGPWQLMHDHDAGVTSTVDKPDPLTILNAAVKGITARTMAQALTGDPDPSRANVERARRRLEGLTGRQLARKREGDPAAGIPALYLPATTALEVAG